MLPHLDALTIVVLIVSMIISLTIHEFMHAFVGHRLGDTTAFEAGRVSFNPLHHIDPFATVILPIITVLIFGIPLLAAKPVPFNPSRLKYGDMGSALVAAAGPLTNLVLAILGALLAHGATGSALTALAIFVQLNVVIFVFNLIPIPPLDGSRVLYSFAPDSVRELFDRIEPLGIIIVFGLVMLPASSTVLVNLENFVLGLLP